ncbi:hypothetical protein AMATHDRAFT_154585 [Amanita thiersii Skay4041]|uniref:mRNA-capping enzyme subunit beta n=1 Tax=Amanita thiersii Skay4041 TaxID=703135 RepID=A0A2A9NE50_9AGAR|nr:hypothetical protein AMATHDRAFT_154585 [Amanita thiersii Skay4041]
MSRTSSPPPTKRARHDSVSQSGQPPNGGAIKIDALPPLSLSILGVEPLDEFIKEIADFVHHMIMTRPDMAGSKVEVEAKIGVVRERTTGQRLALPVLVETILVPDLDIRFESNMAASQHKHFNVLLNELRSSQMHSATPLSYQHLYLVDSFYPCEGNDREKVRVTRDETNGKVMECMRKIRLGDLNVYSPKRSADWRVSVNLEVPVSHPIGSASHTRRKDRMSYAHEEFVIDLTQVSSTTTPNAPVQVSHELEIEIARSDLLLATALKRGAPNASEYERSAFDELIRAFVNNARILVRNALDTWH